MAMPNRAAALVDRPSCADPALLRLVDAAFDKPGGPEGMELRNRVCPRCPVAAQCLGLAMSGEFGVWGGASLNARSRAGAPHPLHGKNRRPSAR